MCGHKQNMIWSYNEGDITFKVEGKIVKSLISGILQISGAKSGRPRVWPRLKGKSDGRWRWSIKKRNEGGTRPMRKRGKRQ